MMERKPLLLLHGALGHVGQFSALKHELDPTFEVHSFNFEGHGGRESNRAFSMPHFVENVLEYLSDQGIQEIFIFGYSMGGYVALCLAQQHLKMVKGIISYGTKFAWNLETAKRETKMLDAKLIAEKVPKYAAALQSIHGKDQWEVVLEKTAQMITGLGADAPLDETVLNQIDLPVRILIGTEDQMVSLEESNWAAHHLSQGEMQSLRGFKHPLEKVDPKALASYIRF